MLLAQIYLDWVTQEMRFALVVYLVIASSDKVMESS